MVGHGRGYSGKNQGIWGPGGGSQSPDRPLGYHRPFVFLTRPAQTP
ncbi:hypothetical protein XCR_3430 [Xanthomonas campestris pv. raphani 756C]|nr:hypothetical protein XCR_3430 [Xanthomonas campestris pv. raphani 756C]